jgi:hypothetical protein
MLYLSAVVLVLSCTRLAGFVSRGSLLGSSTIRACTHTNRSVKLFSILLIPLLTFPPHLLLPSRVVDPQIRTSDLQIRLWIRILLFCQWLTRCQKKSFFSKFFFPFFFLRVHYNQFSLFIDIKVKKKSQNCRNQGFSYFFACLRKDPDPDQDPDKILTDPDGPKT